MNISLNLLNIRNKYNLSQNDLAKKLNVSRQTIYNWEHDKSLPDIFNIVKICDIFQISIDKFLNGDINDKEMDNKNEIFIHQYIIHILNFFSMSIISAL